MNTDDRVAQALARADDLEFVVSMPSGARIYNPDFGLHVQHRVQEARRLIAAFEAWQER